jgi:hypothetical protein
MSVNFDLMVALLTKYNSKPVPKRGRPLTTIKDIDRSKVDEVIHDAKLDDGMRSKIGSGESRQRRANG